MANYKSEIKQVQAVFSALSDISRIRILMSLRDEPLCVCRIIALLGLAPSTVSKHLYILKQSDLIEADKKGRWMYYRLSPAMDKKLMNWLKTALTGDEKIRSDAAALKRILKEDPEKLCRKIKKS